MKKQCFKYETALFTFLKLCVSQVSFSSLIGIIVAHKQQDIRAFDDDETVEVAWMPVFRFLRWAKRDKERGLAEL